MRASFWTPSQAEARSFLLGKATATSQGIKQDASRYRWPTLAPHRIVPISDYRYAGFNSRFNPASVHADLKLLSAVRA
ncbi:MAG: hypothetical protein DMG63_18235 [Acidobacteria bacterium]|nr:MAG: hypothetical protein DMG63_18235 [Acidobacteriota bacterium]